MTKPFIEDCDGDLAEIEQIAESRDWIAKRAAIRNSAIERCAKVAEKYADEWIEWETDAWYAAAKVIAAEIRALKEKP